MNPESSHSLPGVSSDDSLMLLRITAELSFNSVVITDGHHNILYANPAFCHTTGYDREELVGQNPRILQGPLTETSVIAKMRRDLDNSGHFSGSTINYRKDGSPYLVEWTIAPVKDGAGKPRFFVSIQKDITHLHAEQSTGNLFVKAIDAAYDGIFITNTEGVIEFANQGFEIITGYLPIEVVGRKPSVLKSGEHDDEFYRDLCQQTITPIKDAEGTITHFISIIKDLSDRVFEELKLREQASHDVLTGLLNRRAGEIELNIALIQAQESLSPFCVLMADIDNFKPVNDTFGHNRGDEVIRVVADILREHTRKTDKAVRWGGEEFIVLLPFCGLGKAMAIAENIRSALAGMEFDQIGQITLSIGVTESAATDSPSIILERVDQLLYDSKENGKNQVTTG